MITEVPGVWAGHWTDAVGRTGCTVALFPEGTVASGEVRGGAPATRETALLAPERLVDRVVLASEPALEAAVRGLVEAEHLVAEGAGATAVAAVLAGTIPRCPGPAAVVVSGANIDSSRLASILAA